MAATQTADIKALLGADADGDRVVSAHFLVGAMFLALAGALELLALGKSLSVRYRGLEPRTLEELMFFGFARAADYSPLRA